MLVTITVWLAFQLDLQLLVSRKNKVPLAVSVALVGVLCNLENWSQSLDFLPKIFVRLMYDVGAVWQDHTQDFPFTKQLAASFMEFRNLMF